MLRKSTLLAAPRRFRRALRRFGSPGKLRAAHLLLMLAALLLFQNQFALAASCTSKAAQDIVIALDVGHLARQPGQQCDRWSPSPCPWGTTSARGIPEYDFNLKLATRVNEELLREGFRSTRLFVPAQGVTLSQRADRANDIRADIFLSIHHDGVRPEALQQWTYKGELQYFFDGSKGFSLHVSPQNPRYQESLGLARLLADQLMQRGLQFATIHAEPKGLGARVPFVDPTRGIYRRDNLVVLYETEMPAVLLEGGVVVNREEELLVSTAAYQTLMASVVVQSIRAFCRGPQSSAYKVSGVAANDVLNIRSGPDANSGVVSNIPPDGRGVRIVGGCSGQWCPIEYLNTRGWVNRRFLVSE